MKLSYFAHFYGNLQTTIRSGVVELQSRPEFITNNQFDDLMLLDIILFGINYIKKIKLLENKKSF